MLPSTNQLNLWRGVCDYLYPEPAMSMKDVLFQGKKDVMFQGKLQDKEDVVFKGKSKEEGVALVVII